MESPDAKVSLDTCPIIVPRNVDIDTQQEFEKFDFQVSDVIRNGDYRYTVRRSREQTIEDRVICREY